MAPKARIATTFKGHHAAFRLSDKSGMEFQELVKIVGGTRRQAFEIAVTHTLLTLHRGLPVLFGDPLDSHNRDFKEYGRAHNM